MVWCGVTWRGAVCGGAVRRSARKVGFVWEVSLSYTMGCYGMVWHAMVCDFVWRWVRCGVVWCGVVWGVIWYELAW